MPSHPPLHFLRRWLALGPFHWPTRSILESQTIISGEVTTRSTKEVSSPGSTTIWTNASKMWPISSSRASRRRSPAYRPNGVRRDDRGTKEGIAAYLLGRLCLLLRAPSPFAFFCERTRSPFGGEARGLRHRVISPSASVDSVLCCCRRSVRRRRDAIGAHARPLISQLVLGPLNPFP